MKRQKVLTKFEDVPKIAGEIIKIKNVKAVYLFGSYTTGKVHALSDIDICVIGNLNEKEKSKAMSALSDNLDITLFNDLPISIRFKMFKEGNPLIVKDKEFVDVLKMKTAREYIDFKYVINQYCEEVLGCTI